jgi:hypothetical protein
MKNVVFTCLFHIKEGICWIITVSTEVLKYVLAENIFETVSQREDIFI